MLSKVGVKNVIDTAHKMGITTLRDDYYGLALTLGGGEVKLLDMVYAFGTLGNNGVMAGQPVPADRETEGFRKLDPVKILQVRDKTGKIVYEYTQPALEQAVDPPVAYVMTNMLSDAASRWAAFGRPNDLEIPDRQVAAKTGTTNNWRDNWTVGYTPQIAVGVWAGNTDNTPMEKISGLTGAAPIFNAVMQYALRDLPKVTFPVPSDIERETVCYPSGLLPTADCQQKRAEIFIAGTKPSTYDTVWRAFDVNRETGKLATPYTPPELVERRVYETLPAEAADWIVESGLAQPPSEYDTAYGPGPIDEEVAITSPTPYSYTHSLVQVFGNARSGDFRNYRVEFGEGLNPGAWTQIGPEHGDQKQQDVLEFWDTTGLDGLYTLRLSVTEGSGNVRTAAVQVTVDNAPPAIAIEHPREGKVYVMEDDEWISITADARDNWSMDRVDFYLDGNKVASSTVAPYNGKWTIVMRNPKANETDPEYTEEHEIYVEAFDSAGNSAKSDTIKVKVKSKGKQP
jgi:hypothetical protein